MKLWNLVCSADAISIDYEETICSDEEPGFWDCYNIAQEHGCEWFCCEEAY